MEKSLKQKKKKVPDFTAIEFLGCANSSSAESCKLASAILSFDNMKVEGFKRSLTANAISNTILMPDMFPVSKNAQALHSWKAKKPTVDEPTRPLKWRAQWG